MKRIGSVLFIFLGFFNHYVQGEENFILIDGKTSEVVREFGPSIYERVTPACSFNIALSLIGYNARVLQDEKTPTWDFQEGYDDSSESWKSSQTPQTWMSRSCVRFSKIIALQLGLETIQQHLALFEYGNQDLSGGLAEPGLMDPAWVSFSLKISPKEQVHFVQKMLRGKLPVSSHALQMTRMLLFKEELHDGWKLYGKSGLVVVGEESEIFTVRWFVGWVENDHAFFPFAYQMRDNKIDIIPMVPKVKPLLEESNIMNSNEGERRKSSSQFSSSN